VFENAKSGQFFSTENKKKQRFKIRRKIQNSTPISTPFENNMIHSIIAPSNLHGLLN